MIFTQNFSTGMRLSNSETGEGIGIDDRDIRTVMVCLVAFSVAKEYGVTFGGTLYEREGFIYVRSGMTSYHLVCTTRGVPLSSPKARVFEDKEMKVFPPTVD